MSFYTSLLIIHIEGKCKKGKGDIFGASERFGIVKKENVKIWNCKKGKC